MQTNNLMNYLRNLESQEQTQLQVSIRKEIAKTNADNLDLHNHMHKYMHIWYKTEEDYLWEGRRKQGRKDWRSTIRILSNYELSLQKYKDWRKSLFSQTILKNQKIGNHSKTDSMELALLTNLIDMYIRKINSLW